jgi:hypothetical protein
LIPQKMKYTFLILTVTGFLLAACSRNTDQQQTDQTEAFQEIDDRNDLSANEKEAAKAASIQIGPNSPLALTESDWVAMPLGYSYPDSKSRSYDLSSWGRKSKKFGDSGLYNVLFYNPTNQEHHLLLDSCCVAIESLAADSTELQHLAASYIFYIFLKDDPKHRLPLRTLYATDRTGQKLVQVSPPGFHVQSWHPIRGARQVLLELVQDTNADSLLTRADAPSLWVANLKETFPNLQTLVARPDFEAARKALLPPVE